MGGLGAPKPATNWGAGKGMPRTARGTAPGAATGAAARPPAASAAASTIAIALRTFAITPADQSPALQRPLLYRSACSEEVMRPQLPRKSSEFSEFSLQLQLQLGAGDGWTVR